MGTGFPTTVKMRLTYFDRVAYAIAQTRNSIQEQADGCAQADTPREESLKQGVATPSTPPPPAGSATAYCSKVLFGGVWVTHDIHVQPFLETSKSTCIPRLCTA